ncbi:agmatinase [Dehalobacterium formicoaceticum]|uniref:Agmatinase n=1 Tax=Dehalobacterium formicoaceticum TaxID=51515 RepID=A0ABT1Y7A7_9FIRM|nr:agmatinase [Dehalobacterium formicoaceticum]MCR6546767.1 agmatinase [Dehalobacterium formicoaceticum]
MHERKFHTFIGCDGTYVESKIVLFGAPFDSTTSYRPGARFASAAIRNESYSIETYSPYLDRDLTDLKIYDGGDLELAFGNPEKALTVIENYTAQVLHDNKLPLMIGGEHLVTLGGVRAVLQKYPQLHILHFDAHTDLRSDYLGEKLSHATVMRRCWDLVGDGRIFQFGIRSGDREEFSWAQDHVFMEKFTLNQVDHVVEKVKDQPVYLTLDLDVLDPAVLPGTGTLEAGGVGFLDLLKVFTQVKGLNLVGVDMNELCPVYDPSGASTLLACKLLRELLLTLDQ